MNLSFEKDEWRYAITMDDLTLSYYFEDWDEEALLDIKAIDSFFLDSWRHMFSYIGYWWHINIAGFEDFDIWLKISSNCIDVFLDAGTQQLLKIKAFLKEFVQAL